MDPTSDASARDVHPPELANLLGPLSEEMRARAWTDFVRVHSPLLLRVARSLRTDHDTTMDLYAYVLEQLKRDEFRRLRLYPGREAGKFSTWLAVVVRRLCVDAHRARYGRSAGAAAGNLAREQRAVRRRLVDLLAEEIDVGKPVQSSSNPEHELRDRELSSALADALATLPSPDRLLLKLRFEDDLSAREVAQVLNFPTPFHVYRRLSAVLESLRSHLIRHGFRDPRP